ncbi:MAG: hypothetical protein ACRDWG_07175 [Actinomycetes bacterium]
MTQKLTERSRAGTGGAETGSDGQSDDLATLIPSSIAAIFDQCQSPHRMLPPSVDVTGLTILPGDILYAAFARPERMEVEP